MHIRLRCSKCNDSSLVPFEELYASWKKGYDSIPTTRKKRVRVKTDVCCHCGNRDSYNSPMFTYIFQIIFREFMRKESA